MPWMRSLLFILSTHRCFLFQSTKLHADQHHLIISSCKLDVNPKETLRSIALRGFIVRRTHLIRILKAHIFGVFK